MLNTTPLAPVTPTYVQVNIGRNVGDTPLSPRQWAGFMGLVEGALRAATIGQGTISIHTGRGAWLSEDGNTVVSEDSAYISTFAVVDVPALRKALATARDFAGQDAIALIVGSELI